MINQDDMNKGDKQGRTAQIDYPCVWQYKLIGSDQEAMRAAVSALLGDAPYSFSESRRSSAGRYLCMNLEVAVESDEQRQAVFQHLAGHPAVRLLL
ncbi:YbeD family protein [Candidatus Electronema sp. JC]|uniref:HP0495 family protein n=1 Tax=Candidatus Electronema sp. JC TaxID=3401570 RepID=UPI003B438D95